MSENEETPSIKENKCVYSSFSLVDFFASLFSFSKKKEESNPIIEEQKEDIFEPFVEKGEEAIQEQEEPVQEQEQEEPVQEQEQEEQEEQEEPVQEQEEQFLEKELIEPILEKEEEKRDIEEVVKSIEDKIQSFQENYDLYIKNKSEEEALV